MTHIISLTQDDHLPWAGSQMELIREELGENGVLVLHEGLCVNGATPKSIAGGPPMYFYRKTDRVKHVIKQAHKHGLRCAMYVHPGECSKLTHWADTLGMINEHIKAFELDGCFLDGCGFGIPMTFGGMSVRANSKQVTDIMKYLRSCHDVLIMHASVPVWAYNQFTKESDGNLARCETISIDEWMYLATHVLLGETNYDMGGRPIEGHLDPWFRHMQRHIADQYYASRFKEREFTGWHHSHIALKPTRDSGYDFGTMKRQYDAGDDSLVKQFYGEAFQAGACCYLGPWGIRRQFVSKYYKELPEMGDV